MVERRSRAASARNNPFIHQSTDPKSVYSAFRIPHYCETGWLGVKDQRLKTRTRSKAKTKDRLTKARRSWNMSRITGKNTKPEMIVRSTLHRMGYRFRLHDRKLPGCPDIVMPKYKTVIFVHGCFWHRHKGCKNCTTPTNRREWWLAKLNGNAERDKRHRRALIKLGWKPIVVWECKTDRSEKVFRLADHLSGMLKGSP